MISNLDMLATLAAITGQDVEPAQLADSVNVLPALVTDTETPVRDHLVLLPLYSTHVSVRKGKWMYIPQQGAGGFIKDPGQHAAGGAICAAFVGNVNSDFDASGKYKPDAPTAQLYDLESDVNQTRNVYASHPEVVQQMDALLKTYRSQNKRSKSKPRKQ